MIGWEFNVAHSTLKGAFPNTQEGAVTIVLVIAVLVAVGYTATGGLKANAIANVIQNTIKFVVFISLAYLAFGALSPNMEFLPSPTRAVQQLGWWGLLTNTLFSLAWQFVDMSTWQSVIATDRSKESEAGKRSLTIGGWLAFLAPGVLGTIIGMSLAGIGNLDPDSLINKGLLPTVATHWIVLLMIAIVVFATMMSLLDGLLLASGYALIVDVIFGKRKHLVDRLFAKDPTLELAPGSVAEGKIILLLRVSFLALGLIGSLGVKWVLDLDVPKLNLFTFVYVLVVCQLALFGPVMCGLTRGPRISQVSAVGPMLLALAVGLVSVAVGVAMDESFLLEGAGTFTMISSFVAMRLAISRDRR